MDKIKFTPELTNIFFLGQNLYKNQSNSIFGKNDQLLSYIGQKSIQYETVNLKSHSLRLGIEFLKGRRLWVKLSSKIVSDHHNVKISCER